jgi:hypothetical protein
MKRGAQMNNKGALLKGNRYCIRVEGELDRKWVDWFNGLTITTSGDGESLLSGAIADQSALHGILIKIRDLGLVLLSVQMINEDQIQG